MAPPVCAQSGIDFDPSITQAEFEKFSRVIAQGIYASPVHPAGSASLIRFDIGLAVTAVPIDMDASYWRKAIGNEDIAWGNYVGVPRLVVVKGLSVITVAGSYAKIPDTDITVLGGSIDVPIIDGGLLKPTVALRGSYSTITGIEDIYKHKTYGLELFLGKGFGPVTPYGAIGRMRTDARGTIPATAQTPEIVLVDKGDIDRYTVGVRISLGVPKLVVEATQAEERSYSVKISVGL